MDWDSIIKRGVESDVLDYKSAQNWNHLSKAGRAKFARHCMALANTKGGHVVVGVGEDASGKPALFTGMTDEQCLSFDPTAVGNFINRYSDPQVEFTVERPVVDGKQYIVFDIKRFRHLPHVCTCTCDHELQQGVFYIRTADASSRPAYRASEVLELVQRAMRNQREELGRMIRGLLYENHLLDSSAEAQSRFSEEVRHSRDFFRKCVKAPCGNVVLELILYPMKHQEDRFTLSSLRSAAEHARRKLPSFIPRKELKDSYVTNVSLRGCGTHHVWQLYRSGLFHYALDFSAKREISYSELKKTIEASAFFVKALMNSLGLADEEIELRFFMHQTEGLKLSGFEQSICRIPEIEIKRHYPLPDGEAADYSADLLHAVCERFNIPYM